MIFQTYSNEHLHSQLDFHADGDFILIYDVSFDGNLTLISRLSGPDRGPGAPGVNPGTWDKKVISSSSNNMIIEFKSDNDVELNGFAASILFTQKQKLICEAWMDMKYTTIQSPNYPDSYNNNILWECLITVQHGYHITLNFNQFDVRVQ